MGIRDSEEGVKPPKRVCVLVNTSSWLAHHILSGERRTLVDVVVNETGSDESKRLFGRADT